LKNQIDTGRRFLMRLWLGLLGAFSLSSSQAAVVSETEIEHISDDVFWSVIEPTLGAGSNPDRQAKALERQLSRLTASRVAGFQAAFDRQMRRSYTWALWGAAYVIEGGASDDSFDYFRAWLIARGQSAFERALLDPEALATIIPARMDEAPEFEDFGYLVGAVWSAKTGRPAQDMPLSHQEEAGGEPTGSPFEEDEGDLARRYPRLWARFGSNPL
jgi:hypothetical protein